MNKKIFSSDIADFLNLKLYGDNFEIKLPKPLDTPMKNGIAFMINYDESVDETLKNANKILVITNKKMHSHPNFIISEYPKLDFARVLAHFFEEKEINQIYPTAVIEAEAIIGKNVNVGPYSYIGKDVSIGDNTFIANNVTIVGKTTIGNDCEIQSGAVIGSEGFNFPYDEGGKPIRFPHFGSVEIGNRVRVGANSAIDRGTLSITMVEDDVKIDNLVHIAHNCFVGENTVVVTGAVLCGGVKVGKNCWIAPNVSIRQKISVGNHCMVGLGAVVVKDVMDNVTVLGNPARVLKTKET